MDLALNNLPGLICHKTQQTKPNQTEIIIWNYLDYVFLLLSYWRILIHIYFHTVLSEKQIPNTILHI